MRARLGGIRLGGTTYVAVGTMLLFWASAFAAIRAALSASGPGELALLRFLTASVVLGLVALVRRAPLPRLRDLPLFLLVGVVGITTYHLALNFGEVTVSAGSASLIVASTPAFTALFAHFALRERSRLRRWIGIATSFVGVFLISLGEGEAFRIELGALLVLLAAIAGSSYNILQKRFMGRYPPLDFTTYVIWAGTLPFLSLPTRPFGGASGGRPLPRREPSSTSGSARPRSPTSSAPTLSLVRLSPTWRQSST